MERINKVLEDAKEMHELSKVQYAHVPTPGMSLAMLQTATRLMMNLDVLIKDFDFVKKVNSL